MKKAQNGNKVVKKTTVTKYSPTANKAKPNSGGAKHGGSMSKCKYGCN